MEVIMKIHYNLVYLKGQNQENEDAYVVDSVRGVFSVIDGATGLGGLSGKIAAGIIKEAIIRYSNGSLFDAILKGNEILGKNYRIA